MKKITLKAVLLSAALAGTMVSCQKDGEMGPSQELSQKSLAQETSILFYKIDGIEYYQKFHSREERNEFIRYLIRLTTKGHIIVIKGDEKPSMAPSESDQKDFKTFDKAEIDAWAMEMESKGYTVSYKFNKETGTYIGRVIPNETGTTTTAISTERDSDSM